MKIKVCNTGFGCWLFWTIAPFAFGALVLFGIPMLWYFVGIQQWGFAQNTMIFAAIVNFVFWSIFLDYLEGNSHV